VRYTSIRQARKDVESAQTALERSKAMAELARRELRLFRISFSIVIFGMVGVPAGVVGVLTNAPLPLSATLLAIGTLSLLVAVIAAIWSYRL
jgi:hypothetical protein